MNKIYKVIWSRVRNCYVVVSELAKRAGKEKNCHLGPAAHLAAGALCLGLLTFGSQVLPAEAAGEPTVADTTQNQYVAFRVTVNDGNVKGNDNGRDTNTFNGATYHKVTLSDGKTQYWVREGYTLTEGTAEKYTALSRTDSKFDVAYTGSEKQPADILSNATSAVSSAGVSTNAGETLNQVTASAFEGLSQGGGTQVPGNWDYIIYDPSWEGHTQANTSTRTYYKDGYADMYNRSASATGSPLGFVTTTDANTKLVWNGTLNQYTYNGHAVDTSHLYVIGGKLGVFTSYDGSEVYTGTVYGANNEILMTAMKDGKYYSYWAAPVTAPNATMGTYRVSDYNKDLETLKDNDMALYHNDIKSVDLAKGGDTANPSLTITAMRNGSGTAQAVDGAITVTGGGGTGGQDTTVTLSNTTNGSTVSQIFTTGSKVTANTTAAPSAATEMKSLTINGTTYATDLKFGGDNHASATLTKNLSEELDILGGADSTKLTDGNIGVNASDGTLKVQLAQNVDLTSAGSLTVGNTKIDTSGLTITHTDSSGASNNVILTGSQVSMGGNQITNVASGGDTGTNGANINDIIRVSQAKNIATGDKNITVTSSTDTSTNVRTTTVELNDTVTLGSNAANQVTLDGTKGTVSIGNTGDASSKNAIQLDGTAGTAKVGAITIGQQTFDYSYQQPVVSSSGGLSLQTATGTASGTFVTGLSNTTWTPGDYVSGRAATEDELEQAGRHFLSIGTTVAENTLANYYNDGATGTNSMAFGVGTKSSGNFAVSMGINSTASGLGALAVGYNSAASGTESVAVGTQNNASGNYSVALGVGANAGTANTDSSSTANGAAVAVGFTASATRTGSSAYGYNAQATADEGTALGVASLASVEGGVALGAHSVANTAEGVKGYLAETTDTSPTWVSTGGAVSLGGKTTDEEGNAITVSRQITNLAAGSEDTDAVNVAQLRSLEREGMNFQGNNTDTTVHMNQGGTLQVQGTGTKAATEYSGENILVTGVSETADDGKTVTTKLNIGLDKNIRVDSVTAGQATTDSVQGYAGSVKIVGPSADSTQYVATSLGVGYGTADVTGTNINRLQYIDGDGTTRHAVATLEDGLKLAGDAGTGTVKLDSTLSVTGGEGASANLASGNNIGVTASDGALKLQLAKDLTGLNSVTAGTVVMGSQADGSDATQTGDFVTGLDNKTWTVGTTKAVSGRAATEDQLQSVATVVDTNRTKIAANTADIAKGLNFTTNTADASDTTGYKVVNKALGDTVSIKAHDAQSGHTYKTDNLTTSIDDSGNITIAMDTQLTADKITVGTGSNALTLDGSNGTLTTGSSALNGTGLTITDGPSLTTSGISGGSQQITKVASGASGVDTAGKAVYGTTDNAANIGDVKTIAAQMVTVSKDSTKNNTKVTKTTKTDGTVDYEVALNDTLTLGDNSYAVLNGTAGTLSLGNLLFLDGSNGYGTIGSLHLGNYSGTDSSWTLTDNKNGTVAAGTYLTGLTNTAWVTADPTYVSGRAATEDELAAVSSTVNTGWNAQVDGITLKAVTPASNLNFAAGDNMQLTGSGSTITIATQPDVDFTTVRVGGTKGTDGTYTGGIYIGSQAGGGANSGTGFYITGLSNTNWDADNIVGNRAATEAQLKAAINDVNEGTVANDNYVTDGSVTDDTANPGSMTASLTMRNKNKVNISGLHDYYVTGGSVSTTATTADDGTTSTAATLTLNKNNGTSVDVDLSSLSNMDYHLVENSASGSNGAYSVDANGDVKLTVASPTDTVGKEITISGLASKTALEQGLTFTASALADGATSLTHTAQLGDTIGIYGGTKQDGHTYNTNNITTTISDKGDIRVLLDDNLTATSLTAGSKTTDDAAGVDGSVMATGQGGAYLKMNGADGSLRMGDASGNFAAMVQNYGGPKFLDSTAAGSPRIQYWAASAGQTESDASQTLYTLATLNDGLQLAGDSGTGSVALDKTLTVTGGATASSDLSSGSNIGVTASGSTLQLQLAKKLTGLTSISLGNDMVLGNQASGSATGDYLTGLDNTTWSGTPVSGRAATEDQLKLVSDSLSEGTKSTGGFGLTADVADSTTSSQDVKQSLGKTIKITAEDDDNLTTTADATNTAIKLALSKNLKLTSAAYTDTAGNNTTVTGTGITIAKAGSTDAGKVSLTTAGLDNGGNQIVDVASGLGGTELAKAAGEILNHAATIGDLQAAAKGVTDSSDTKGLNFVGNSNPVDSTTGSTAALHANLGGTVSILGTGTDEDDNYSGRNVKVINKNNALYVELDKDLEVRSLQAGYGESGNNVQGQLLLYGADNDGTYSNLILESQYMDGKPYLTNTTTNGNKRLVYKEGEDSTTVHTVATMSDGLKFSDDNGSTAAVTLGSTLAVTGGAAQEKLAKDANGNLITGNIGVVAAENADGTSGSLALQLAKDINLGSQGSLTADKTKVGYQTATTKVNQSAETGDYVTGLTNTTWSGTDYVSGRAATEDQLNVLSTQLKDNLANSTYSITAGGSGNTGTDTVTAKLGTGTIRIFGDAPVVTSGGDGDGWDRSKANILTKVKYDSANNSYVSVELQDHLEVGVHQVTDASGNVTTEGVDGTMQFKGSGSSEVNISGDNGITLTHIRSDGNPAASSVRITGPSESDGKELNGAMSITTFNQTAKTTDSAASIYGESGEGHLYLNTVNPGEGQGNAAGLGASADVVAQYGAASLDAEKNDSPSSGGAAGTPIMTRLTYTDQSGKTHQAATMDDGLLLTGDSGTVTRLLNSTLKMSGGVTDKDKLSDGANLGVVANAAGDGFDIKLAKDLTGLDSITLNGGLKISGSTAGANTITGLSNTPWNGTAVSGRAATEDQLQAAVAGVTDASKGGGFGLTDDAGKAAKADLGGTVGIHGDRNITTSVSSDGKSINVGLNKDVDLGNDGSIKAGGVTIDSSGIDAGSKNITNVKSGIINHDASDNTNAANIGDVKSIASDAANAAVSGGRVFQGDDGADNKVTVTMGTALKLTGGQTDTAKLTDGNIGMVKNADGDGLDIKLSKELTGLTSVTAGNSTLNNEGLTVNNSAGSAGTTVTGSGIKIAANGENTHAVEISNSNVSLGGQQIHDVAAGTKPTDAVNVSQLGGVVSGVSNAITRLDSRVDRVGAGASALAALHPLEYDPEDKLNFAAGFGHYRSANAAAIGAFYQPTESVRFNVGGSFGGGENMVNAGVTFSLDPQRRDRFQSRIALMRTVQQLRSDNETLRQDNQKVHAQLDAMNDRLNALTALVELLSAKK